MRKGECYTVPRGPGPVAKRDVTHARDRRPARGEENDLVVPHASVTLTNMATNVPRNTMTNESGVYVFPGVFPGPYRLTVESPGMRKYEANLTVQAQQDATVDVGLQVGETVTQVEVKDVTPLVVTSNPSFLSWSSFQSKDCAGRVVGP